MPLSKLIELTELKKLQNKSFKFIILQKILPIFVIRKNL
jgi:hypothetical protein